MRHNDANSRWSAPRLLGASALTLGTLVCLLIGFTGGASAVVGSTDLGITKTDSPDPVVAGGNVTYTIDVSNTSVGANDANPVTVTDNLPSGVDFVSATPTQGTCDRTGDTVTCQLGQVNAGNTARILIVVKTKKDGTLTNTATVATGSGDPNATNNTAQAVTAVQKATGKGKGKGKGKVSCATPTITGTPGNDVITGTAAGDVIVTYEGNDQVSSLGGKDLVCTGAGLDTVFGGDGGDTAIGGGNADRLVGQAGGDLLKGKAGRDKLRGKGGNDTLNGGKKKDSCKGGAGRDTLIKCP